MSEPAKIHKAIIAIMRAVGPIAKASQNSQQNYKFRGIDAVYNACHPHLAEHGVYCTSEIIDAQHDKREVSTKGGKSCLSHAILRMRFTYHAEDGSSVATEVVGEGMDYNGDKASNKAMSVADKYALLQLLKIPTAAVDPDRGTHDNPDHDPAAPTQPPRDERIDKDKLIKLNEEWLANNDGAQTQDWLDYVLRACGRDFNPLKLSQWTLADYTAVKSAVDLEVLGDNVPY